MAVEVLNQTQEIARREIRREDFGPGYAGRLAYIAVLIGAPCETWIDDRAKCGKSPIGTVDVDILGDVDPFPYCSEEHAQLLTDQLVSEIMSQGRSTVPGRNGFGRA